MEHATLGIAQDPKPRTTTLKQIPDELYRRLKTSAQRNRRSLNQEMIVCLERGVALAVADDGLSPLERVDRLIAAQRARGVWVLPEDIDAAIEEGRL